MSAVDSFAQIAKAFCAWIASPPADEVTEARLLRQHLAALIAAALALPSVPYGEYEAAQPGKEEWERVFRRAGSLPFNYYSVTNPLEVPTDVVTIGDLADDIADTWSDVVAGLKVYEEGHKDDAAIEWRARFDSHWGSHAADGLAAIQEWHSTNMKN